MMHFETFDLFGVIKLVNALCPPPSTDCLNPARRDNWKGEEEGVGAMVLVDEPQFVWEITANGCVGQEIKLRSNRECVGRLPHSLGKQELAELRCSPVCPTQGAPDLPFIAASHSLAFWAKIQI